MAKCEEKRVITIDGGIYDHATRTVTVEMKEEIREVPIDELLEKIDGFNIKIVASMDVIEE